MCSPHRSRPLTSPVIQHCGKLTHANPIGRHSGAAGAGRIELHQCRKRCSYITTLPLNTHPRPLTSFVAFRGPLVSPSTHEHILLRSFYPRRPPVSPPCPSVSRSVASLDPPRPPRASARPSPVSSSSKDAPLLTPSPTRLSPTLRRGGRLCRRRSRPICGWLSGIA